MNLHTLRPGKRHGYLSADLLRKHNILEDLTARQKEIIIFAVQYHSEKEVPLKSENIIYEEDQKVAFKLCYILRDLDKKDILSNKKFMEPEGIFGELIMHYKQKEGDENKNLFSVEDIEELKKNKENYLNEIEYFVREESQNLIDNPKTVSEKLHNIMNGGIHPEALESFSKNKLISVQLVNYSWPTYMLWLSAFTFDIQSKSSVMEVLKNRGELLEDKIDYIERKCPQHIGEINNVLNKYQNFRQS